MKIALEIEDDLSTVDACIAVVNRCHWNLELFDDEEGLHLMTGEALFGTFESVEERATFIKGLAVAIAVLPAEVQPLLDEWVGVSSGE